MKIKVEYGPYDEAAGVLSDEAEELFCRWAEGVYRERVKQVAKWGDQHHADDTGGEHLRREAVVARTTCQAAAKFVPGNDPGWRLILAEEVAEAFAERADSSSGPGALLGELRQVAAVCAAWYADIQSRRE